MTLHSPNRLLSSFGFIILNPDRHLGGLKNTVGSIKHTHKDSSILCVVGSDAHDSEVEEMNAYCTTYRAGDTIMSLLNEGMKQSTADWNAYVFAGSVVTTNFKRKVNLFICDDRDILFPVVDWQTNFVDGSMNGIVLHKQSFASAGEFASPPVPTSVFGELELVKLCWAAKALENGCVFKAIIGMKIL
jgi:hypothetical protein